MSRRKENFTITWKEKWRYILINEKTLSKTVLSLDEIINLYNNNKSFIIKIIEDNTDNILIWDEIFTLDFIKKINTNDIINDK